MSSTWLNMTIESGKLARSMSLKRILVHDARKWLSKIELDRTASAKSVYRRWKRLKAHVTRDDFLESSKLNMHFGAGSLGTKAPAKKIWLWAAEESRPHTRSKRKMHTIDFGMDMVYLISVCLTHVSQTDNWMRLHALVCSLLLPFIYLPHWFYFYSFWLFYDVIHLLANHCFIL